ncbi:valacyclovir hydrolase-like [Ostrea edulis]|uniref:valacyclovir hydrolase-like n=1 Tax=Ostrea edulis TaxID=37623 RepID=UPI0024AFD398|nr:valacyclovir hydrolase-like [Ostrea edulis]
MINLQSARRSWAMSLRSVLLRASINSNIELQHQAKHMHSDSGDPRFYSLIRQGNSIFLDEQKRSGILSHKISVNGARLHFETTGNGPHTILLLPGALGSSRTDFSKQLSDFNKKDFRLIAFDPRGYGKSIPPRRTWPLEFLQRDADDANELCMKLGLNGISVMGWSDGGITAMILAAKNHDLVKNLVIWGANAYITEQDMKVFNGMRDIKTWSEAMRSPFLSLYGEKYFREQWSNWIDAYQAYFDKRNGDICKDDLKNIAARTLIIHGIKDPMVPLEHPDYLHHHIKGSRLYMLPEGKHNLHIRYYREFNFLVENFLKPSKPHSAL